MQTSATQKVNQLSPELRHAVEGLLGRVLDENETVRVSVSRGKVLKEAPHGAAKLAAGRKLMEHVRQMGSQAPELAAEELDELIDGAVAHARERRR